MGNESSRKGEGANASKPIMTKATTKSGYDGMSYLTLTPDVSNATCSQSRDVTPINRVGGISTRRGSVHNDVVDVYIPLKSVKSTFNFWHKNISDLDFSTKLEISCSIFFEMISMDQKIKTLFVGSTSHKLETLGLKFLDMMGYLIRSLMSNDDNLFCNLKMLGSLHTKRGINFQMYEKMLNGMHETFAHYFRDQYTVQVRLALHEVFSVVSRIMTDQHVTKHVKNQNINYLESLNKCLATSDGKAALLSYLKQFGCHNIVLFYDLLHQFKLKTNDIERFMVARDITRFQINGTHQAKKISISPQTAQKVLEEIQRLDDLWFSKVPFSMETVFFDEVESEINELVRKQYWSGFKESILSTQAR